MSGFCGRYSVRRSFKAGHTNRWCVTVSSGLRQRGHPASVLAPILVRCWLRGMCWDLSRKMVTCSFLLRRLMLSFLFGVFMCSKMDLPLSLVSHSFIQIADFFCLMVCLAVFMDALVMRWVHLAPNLASLSARSLPGMLVCPGIHCRVMSMSWVLIKSLRVQDRFLMTGSLESSFSKAKVPTLHPKRKLCYFFL